MDRTTHNFIIFHLTHPHVYRLFDMFTWRMINRGYRVGSAQLVFERIRWETNVETNTGTVLKINNNYRSRYARLWEHQNGREYFRKRQLKVDSKDSTFFQPKEGTL